MNKILVGLIVGAVLGAVDGLTAWFTPQVRDQIFMIVFLSTIKGMVAGIAAGWFARRVHSVPKGIAFGFIVGLILATLVAMNPDPNTGENYWWQIMVPGSILGGVIGWATQQYGRPGRTASAGVLASVLLLAITGSAQAAEVTAADALARLESLAGEWQGNVIERDGPGVKCNYRVTAGGTAVMETVFAFVSVRGEHAHDREHIHSGVVRFVDADRIEAVWDSMQGEKATESRNFYLQRAK